MKLNTIDLPPELKGSLCGIHLAMGERVTARLISRPDLPVCYDCYAELLNLEVKLKFIEAGQPKAVEGVRRG